MEYKEYYTYIFEDCDCLHEADCGCGEQEEGYPGFGYKETESDFKDPRLQKMEEIVALLEKNTPTNPSKWAAAKAAAKRKFKVYPSAYANLWAAKKYKSMGGGWRKTKKEYHIPHKRRDPMGQEDADINNDGKVDLTDKMLKAKRDLYKRYLVAQKKGQKSL